MADVTIDLTGHDDDEFSVENSHGFDLEIVGSSLTIYLTHEQGRAIYGGLRQFFDDTTSPGGG